nr:hypothetical protein [Micromonospora sp. DSM 115978]
MTTAVGRRYHNERYNEIDARAEARGEALGEARGKALGEAKAVLLVLESRGVAVPGPVRRRILACSDTD